MGAGFFVYSCGSSHVPNEYQNAGTTRLYDGLPSGTHYYSNDHLGSSTLITDESGNEVIRTNYTPYGEIDLIHTGKYDPNTNTLTKNAETDPEYSVLGVRFTGQEYDPESSLYYYNARYYDPSIGVFTTADIYVDGPYNYSGYNRYMYVGGNPVRYTDPTGHCWIFCWLIGGASGGRIGQGGYIPVPQQVSALEQGVMKAAWLGVAAVTGGGLGGFVSGILGGGFLGGVVGGFAGGFTSGFISGFGITGDIGQALLGGLLGGSIGALTGGLSYLLSDSGNGGTLLADYCGNCNGKALPDFDSLSGGLVVSDATYGIPAAEALQNAITKTSTAFGSLGGASGLLGGLANFLFPPPPTVNGQPVNMMGMPDWLGLGGFGKVGSLKSLWGTAKGLWLKGGNYIRNGLQRLKYLSGRELQISKNVRIAPFGNRTGHKFGRWPHYHRRGAIDPMTGRPRDGQGISRHRPWQPFPKDKHWWDRF